MVKRRINREILTLDTGELCLEQEQSFVICQALKERKRPNQNPKPPHFQNHPSHEVEVCQRKEVSKAKVTMVPFSVNRAVIV